jgi:lysophospholipase L1-like esterase
MPTPTPAEAMHASEAPMGSAPEDDSPLAPNAVVSFEADNPFIQYSGRVSFADPKRPEFSAPGVYITARFRGSAVAVLLEDQFKWGNNRSFFDVTIDGEPQPKLAPEMGVTRYRVAENLPAGEHDIVIAKRTEASIGRTAFLGLEIEGELLEAPPKPDLRIEFIGDSITAGAGVEAADGSPDCSAPAIPGADGGWGQPIHNANATYAAVAARDLGAEYHLTAVSGIGLVRNYSSSFDARPMPDVYDLTFPEMIEGNTWDMTVWDTSRFVPDVVVVTLGTNDFSPGDNPPTSPRSNMVVADYVTAYEAFLQTLRTDYPNAEIFALSSPMLGDGWPNPTDTFASDLRASVLQVAADLNAAGDTRVHAFVTSQLSPGLGCGTHPNTAQHQMLGLELAAELRETLGL